jgi:hypothetical protein
LGNLSTPKGVQKLQTALHAKAKAEAGYRFYASVRQAHAAKRGALWRLCKIACGVAGAAGAASTRASSIRSSRSALKLSRGSGLREIGLIKIKTIYAFSTGWLGFSATIRNELIPLSDVKRVVIVDCLYADGGVMQAAMNMLQAATRGAVKIVTYAASNGTPGAFTGQLQVNVPARGVSWLAGSLACQTKSRCR